MMYYKLHFDFIYLLTKSMCILLSIEVDCKTYRGADIPSSDYNLFTKLRLNKIGKKRPYNIADMRKLKQDNVVQQAKEGLTGNSKSCGIK